MASVDVNLVTWPNHPKRLEYFKRTVKALKTFLSTTLKISYYCSAEMQIDESAPHLWQGRELIHFCRFSDISLHWREGEANLGANMNEALRLGESDFIFLVQDDWETKAAVNLAKGIDFFEEYQPDLIRYSWPDIDRMRPSFTRINKEFSLVDLNGRWPYGDDPQLRHRSFPDKWGEYLEGGGHGSASSTMMQRLIKGDAMIVATNRNRFRHIGDVTSVLNDKRNRRITRENYLIENANHPLEGLSASDGSV